MADLPRARRMKFSVVPGLFVDYAELQQKDPAFRVTTFPELGLIDKQYESDGGQEDGALQPWERFKEYVRHLNVQSPANTQYKVLYITRHGFGYHNYCEAKVGSEEWDRYWAKLDGDGEITWADAHLNETGLEQAKALGRFWSDAVSAHGTPLPGAVYTSPLARCLETTRLSFTQAFEEQKVGFHPTVKELLRETIIEHTCDRRSSRTWIAEHYPSYIIEPGFSEEDVLWGSRRWETLEDHIARKQRVFEDIFSTDDNEFIALVAHSGAITAMLGALEHPKFSVREGSCFAFLIKADTLEHEA